MAPLHQRGLAATTAALPFDASILIGMPQHAYAPVHSVHADNVDEKGARRGAAARAWRWRDVFAGITAISALWIALLHTAIVLGAVIGGLELKAKVSEHVSLARPYFETMWPHVQRHSSTADALFEAATSAEARELVARGAAVAQRTLSLAELFYDSRPEEALPLALARAAAWEGRLDALYYDRRMALLARVFEQGAELAETRAGSLFADMVEISNVTHAFIQRQARRMRALEAALAE